VQAHFEAACFALCARTLELLEHAWPAVEAVAQALLCEHRLSARKVREIVARAQRGRNNA